MKGDLGGGRKRQILSWCLFDFANSSYSAVIASVVFPVYYVTEIVGNAEGLGDLWWGRAVSLSMVLVSVSSPFMGGMADFGGIRKRLLMVYTAICVSAVAGLSFLEPGMATAGFLLVVLANFSMEGGLVFYNSFLPEIAAKEYQGRVSAWGYAVGYAGSILSLLIALPFIAGGHVRAVWPMVAVFFALFSLPLFFALPGDRGAVLGIGRAASEGLSHTWSTFRQIWSRRESRRFLLAYLIYEDGVNTVIVFSSIFAATTLAFTQKELVGLYLLVQATALAGAFLMARPIDSRGPKTVVSWSLLLWTSVSVAAFFIHDKGAFWVLASVAGLGLGTVQAASRAFFSQFIPQGSESEYFGVYSMVGKSSAVVGPLIFGYVSTTFASQRPAILSVAIFFFFGLVMLSFVKGGGPNIRAAS